MQSSFRLIYMYFVKDKAITMILSTLLYFAPAVLVLAFQPLQPTTTIFARRLLPLRSTEGGASSSTATRNNSNEDVIRRLRKEYSDLQDELFVYLTFNDKDSAEELAEQMLAKRADLNTVERYNQVLKVKHSAEEVKHAMEDLELAQEIVDKAHAEALVAEYKTHHVDSMDDVFDTAKHERDIKAAQLAHDAEDLAREIFLDVQFEELHAELKYDDAEALLQDLSENSLLLERHLNQIQYEHDLAKHWAEEEMPKHQKFLSTARHTIRSGKLIDHDFTKGDVGF